VPPDMRKRKASATLAGRQTRKAAGSVVEDAECAEKAQSRGYQLGNG